MGTAVLLTARPSSGQWTQLQRSSVPLSHPSWTFSLHDAPEKPTASWRTPPTPPTVSSSSYHQEDGTGASEPTPPDCSTAFSPRLWEPLTQITPPPSETPCKPLPPETTWQPFRNQCWFDVENSQGKARQVYLYSTFHTQKVIQSALQKISEIIIKKIIKTITPEI